MQLCRLKQGTYYTVFLHDRFKVTDLTASFYLIPWIKAGVVVRVWRVLTWVHQHSNRAPHRTTSRLNSLSTV